MLPLYDGGATTIYVAFLPKCVWLLWLVVVFKAGYSPDLPTIDYMLNIISMCLSHLITLSVQWPRVAKRFKTTDVLLLV